jgi:hypothetical protein
MLYLIMVVTAFLCFAAGLMWSMLSTSRTGETPRALSEPRHGATHGFWWRGAG